MMQGELLEVSSACRVAAASRRRERSGSALRPPPLSIGGRPGCIHGASLTRECLQDEQQDEQRRH